MNLNLKPYCSVNHNLEYKSVKVTFFSIFPFLVQSKLNMYALHIAYVMLPTTVNDRTVVCMNCNHFIDTPMTTIVGVHVIHIDYKRTTFNINKNHLISKAHCDYPDENNQE